VLTTMTDQSIFPTSSSEDLTRAHLNDLRHGLLRLHKALVDSERISYERFHGRVTSSGELLQLVIQHEWFAWLHPVSELVVQIDELLDADDPMTANDASSLIERARALLNPSESGAGFEKQYYDALQRDPDVVMTHAQVLQLLAPDVQV